ncbi:PQQ-dependent sugar dehydrogenase [Paenibacillus sp. Marseille-Q4541]|uniref:PQQ-dependent sugar dehydrogenase n=1 Tax=Paenibacillus sp. Marseille-Q4541 TaxID=2831522 RepID=UPI002019235C|nr:PQQ-dependent sugar dehydrogenase [Paenibacillus sp. Marseille-Q4541]
MDKKIPMLVGITLALMLSACTPVGPHGPAPSSNGEEEAAQSTPEEEENSFPYETEVIATGVNVPWEVDFLPDGRMLFTERPGQLRMITDGTIMEEPLISFSAPFSDEGEGGLLGLAIDPDFENNSYVYVYHSYKKEEDIANRVLRLIIDGQEASIDKVLIDDIPGGVNHNGGRIKIGPDRLLYVTTGERYEPDMAQNSGEWGGKILRIGLDGSIPSDNPISGSPVYSLGHRNAQGLAWHPETGVMYSSEHGQSNLDELNIIEKGGNYGWPLIEGDEAADGLIRSVAHSGSETWAPSGMTFVSEGPWKNSLLVGGLRGEQVLRFDLSNNRVEQSVGLIPEVLYEGEWGRIRSINEGPDGTLYILTNNRDGRGIPSADDDQIIALKPLY